MSLLTQLVLGWCVATAALSGLLLLVVLVQAALARTSWGRHAPGPTPTTVVAGEGPDRDSVAAPVDVDGRPRRDSRATAARG